MSLAPTRPVSPSVSETSQKRRDDIAVADMVADMTASMEVDMVANIVADMVADMAKCVF